MNHYTGPLKIGAVYESSRTPGATRRITRVRDGIVEYTLYQVNGRTYLKCALTEDMFREFTAREVPPGEL